MNFVIESYSYTFSHTFRSTYLQLDLLQCLPVRHLRFGPFYQIWLIF